MLKPSQDDKEALERRRAAEQVKFVLGAAIQFEVEMTKSGLATVGVQQAPIITEGRKRRGDWSKKIQLQLNPNTELITFAHMLMRKCPAGHKVKFDFHGTNNNKSLTAHFNNDGGLYVALREGQEKQSYCIIPPSGVTQILTLVVKAYAYRFQMRPVDALSILNVSPVALS
ncbi:hypothetical protein VTH8203_00819 [Vibrio thalassae]|uniref:Uncharacterized protein n=1 Tax=Vibrio thalassae TaxID=1243014 RepID=A0A240EEV2_9VIBR|nr:hypothetical protein [Vibrio thalassae]SNX47218.1 hypothetical protein VTH8203_00819 [Vibrio thalassae]